MWAVGARSLGKAPVVVPGPGPGTVGMPGFAPRTFGDTGTAGIGTNRWAPAWGTSPVVGVADGDAPAAGADPPAPSVPPGAATPAPAGAAVAGAEWVALDFGSSVIGFNEGAGVSAGGLVGWSRGVCCVGTANEPLWGTICC